MSDLIELQEVLDIEKAKVAEVLRRCDVRERDNPFNEIGKPPKVPTWITVADVRNALGVTRENAV